MYALQTSACVTQWEVWGVWVLSWGFSLSSRLVDESTVYLHQERENPLILSNANSSSRALPTQLQDMRAARAAQVLESFKFSRI